MQLFGAIFWVFSVIAINQESNLYGHGKYWLVSQALLDTFRGHLETAKVRFERVSDIVVSAHKI